MNYQDWLNYKSKIEGRDVSEDEIDYDLQGYYNTLKSTPIEGGHLPDTFKKPNHPTFSDQSKYHIPVIQQGGSWIGNQEEGYKFNPSELNMKNMGKSNLQSYFNEVETPESLNLQNSDKLSRLKAMNELSNRR